MCFAAVPVVSLRTHARAGGACPSSSRNTASGASIFSSAAAFCLLTASASWFARSSIGPVAGGVIGRRMCLPPAPPAGACCATSTPHVIDNTNIMKATDNLFIASPFTFLSLLANRMRQTSLPALNDKSGGAYACAILQLQTLIGVIGVLVNCSTNNGGRVRSGSSNHILDNRAQFFAFGDRSRLVDS